MDHLDGRPVSRLDRVAPFLLIFQAAIGSAIDVILRDNLSIDIENDQCGLQVGQTQINWLD